MKTAPLFDKIDLQLIRTLHTLLTERSVSRTALILGQHQPAVSQALRRLRLVLGDPILVRAGTHMVPTEVGLSLLEPAGRLLDAAQALLGTPRSFRPATTLQVFRVAASDTLDPLFLPQLVVRMRQLAPDSSVELQPLNWQAPYLDDLAQGRLDLVIANWTDPNEQLHGYPLFEDEVMSLVSRRHPAVQRGWSPEDWLACDHVAPTSAYPGWRGVIDQQLDAQGLQRHIAVRCAHFGLIPQMVASSLLVLTTGRHFCERHLQGPLGGDLVMLPTPVRFERMTYHQLWHERSHTSASGQWLREQVKATVAGLSSFNARKVPA